MLNKRSRTHDMRKRFLQIGDNKNGKNFHALKMEFAALDYKESIKQTHIFVLWAARKCAINHHKIIVRTRRYFRCDARAHICIKMFVRSGGKVKMSTHGAAAQWRRITSFILLIILFHAATAAHDD